MVHIDISSFSDTSNSMFDCETLWHCVSEVNLTIINCLKCANRVLIMVVWVETCCLGLGDKKSIKVFEGERELVLLSHEVSKEIITKQLAQAIRCESKEKETE